MAPGEEDFRRMVAVWRLEADRGPAPLVGADELVDECGLTQEEAAGYLAEQNYADNVARHARIVERVGFAEGLLRLHELFVSVVTADEEG